MGAILRESGRSIIENPENCRDGLVAFQAELQQSARKLPAASFHKTQISAACAGWEAPATTVTGPPTAELGSAKTVGFTLDELPSVFGKSSTGQIGDSPFVLYQASTTDEETGIAGWLGASKHRD